MAGEAGEGEDAPLMNGSEDTVVMSQLHGESAKEEVGYQICDWLIGYQNVAILL